MGECHLAQSKFACTDHHWNCGWCNPEHDNYPWLSNDYGDAFCEEIDCDIGAPLNMSSPCTSLNLSPPAALRCVEHVDVFIDKFSSTDRILIIAGIAVGGAVFVLGLVFLAWFCYLRRQACCNGGYKAIVDEEGGVVQ